MHGSLHMEHDFKGEYIQKHFIGQFTQTLGSSSPLCVPLLQALGEIFVPWDNKKCIHCFGRTLASHGSENCSAVQTYKCNCILKVDGFIHALYRCFMGLRPCVHQESALSNLGYRDACRKCW